ncbi:hypothetical protein QFZ96_006073 [Paraburkholderia youngii]
MSIDVTDAVRRRAVLAAPAVDEIDQRIAYAFDRRDVQLHRAGLVVESPGTFFERLAVGLRGVLHAKRNRADRRAMQAREALRERMLLRVDDEIDVALTIQRHVLVTMSRNGGETHPFEQFAERFRVRRRVFDEFEAVGADRIFPSRNLHCLSPIPCKGVAEARWR